MDINGQSSLAIRNPEKRKRIRKYLKIICPRLFACFIFLSNNTFFLFIKFTISRHKKSTSSCKPLPALMKDPANTV